MSDPRITDEAVDAAMGVLMDYGHNGLQCDPTPNFETPVRRALEAAAPLMTSKPLLNREAVWRGVYLAAIQPLNPSGVADKATGAVAELAHPMPTRAQIEEALVGIAPSDFRQAIADAVLALINGSTS